MMKLGVQEVDGDGASANAGVKRSASVFRDQRDPQLPETMSGAKLLNVPESPGTGRE